MDERKTLLRFSGSMSSETDEKLVELFRRRQLKKTKGCQQRCLERCRLKRMDRFCCCLYVVTGAKVIIIADFLGLLLVLYLLISFVIFGSEFNFSQFFIFSEKFVTFKDIIQSNNIGLIVYVFYTIIWQLLSFLIRVVFGLHTFCSKFSPKAVEMYYYAYFVTSAVFIIHCFMTIMVQS